MKDSAWSIVLIAIIFSIIRICVKFKQIFKKYLKSYKHLKLRSCESNFIGWNFHNSSWNYDDPISAQINYGTIFYKCHIKLQISKIPRKKEVTDPMTGVRLLRWKMDEYKVIEE